MTEQAKAWTAPVYEAGREYFGLSRSGSYAAARRGDLPTIKIGGRVLANIPAIRRMFEPEEQTT